MTIATVSMTWNILPVKNGAGQPSVCNTNGQFFIFDLENQLEKLQTRRVSWKAPVGKWELRTQNALYTFHEFSYHALMVFHPFNSKRACDFWVVRGAPEHRLNGIGEEIGERTPPSRSPSDQVSVEWQPMALLEAAFFLAKEPVSCRRLAQLAELPEGTKTRQLIRELNKRYDQDQSAFCIVEVAEGFQLRTRPEFAPWLVRMQEVPSAVRLSNPAMETLTVIAYRQPMTRAEVERIRGVQCGDLIRQLLDQDLAKIVGRSKELGRPILYGTTQKFLRVFGLGSLNDLPALEAG